MKTSNKTKYRLIQDRNDRGWCEKHGDWYDVVACIKCGAIDTKCCVARMCRSFKCGASA